MLKNVIANGFASPNFAPFSIIPSKFPLNTNNAPPTRSCNGINHVLLWPIRFTYNASIIGAHKIFNENGHDAKENTPWSPTLAPFSVKENATVEDKPIGTPCKVYRSKSKQMLNLSPVKSNFSRFGFEGVCFRPFVVFASYFFVFVFFSDESSSRWLCRRAKGCAEEDMICARCFMAFRFVRNRLCFLFRV